MLAPTDISNVVYNLSFTIVRNLPFPMFLCAKCTIPNCLILHIVYINYKMKRSSFLNNIWSNSVFLQRYSATFSLRTLGSILYLYYCIYHLYINDGYSIFDRWPITYHHGNTMGMSQGCIQEYSIGIYKYMSI